MIQYIVVESDSVERIERWTLSFPPFPYSLLCDVIRIFLVLPTVIICHFL